MYLSRGGIENLYMKFPYTAKDITTKTEAFQRVLKFIYKLLLFKKK